MNYKIIDIEGIGDVYAPKLIAAGIETVEQLLDACEAPTGRKLIAEKTGISEKLILKWTNHADLFRINGIGPQFAELLEAAGVDTVKELRHRVAANLAAKVAEVNDKVDAAKAALKDATDKLAAAAADASAELADLAQAGFKSLLAGWEEAKKTFGENRK